MKKLKGKGIKQKSKSKVEPPYFPNKGIEPNLDFLNQKGETIRCPETIK